MSSRMFQGVLLQLSEAAQTTIGVIDAEGNVISCSDTTLIGEKWPDAATAVAAMLENPVREEPYTFYALKGWNPAYGYSAFVLGTDAQAEMLVRMTQVSLNSAKAYYEEKHDKGTFVKNIITDNILPGDIYIRAKELHFPTELPRAALSRPAGRPFGRGRRGAAAEHVPRHAAGLCHQRQRDGYRARASGPGRHDGRGADPRRPHH